MLKHKKIGTKKYIFIYRTDSSSTKNKSSKSSRVHWGYEVPNPFRKILFISLSVRKSFDSCNFCHNGIEGKLLFSDVEVCWTSSSFASSFGKDGLKIGVKCRRCSIFLEGFSNRKGCWEMPSIDVEGLWSTDVSGWEDCKEIQSVNVEGLENELTFGWI